MPRTKLQRIIYWKYFTKKDFMISKYVEIVCVCVWRERERVVTKKFIIFIH